MVEKAGTVEDAIRRHKLNRRRFELDQAIPII